MRDLRFVQLPSTKPAHALQSLLLRLGYCFFEGRKPQARPIHMYTYMYLHVSQAAERVKETSKRQGKVVGAATYRRLNLHPQQSVVGSLHKTPATEDIQIFTKASMLHFFGVRVDFWTPSEYRPKPREDIA